MHDCGVYVRCFALEGQIARLEVMGSKAIKMIKKILHPVSQSCSSADDSLLNQSSLTPCSNSQVQKSILLCHAEKIPSHAILSLIVHDPRDLPSSRTEVTDNEHSTILEGYLQGEDSLCSRPEINGIFLFDSISLWDCSNNLNPPVPESIICKEKARLVAETCFHYLISEGEEDLEELQVPQSFTFRWPIGFVTTGFVRGSSKPVAEAFCEARLLAMLRGQQSCDAQTAEAKIFVFVRNMRSTAYQRAMATIVLEQQDDDLGFM
ncbi:hypothetical protein C4D60_Mb02t03250 [Musa balbisiana]|uniref:Uncharacterized protein n=1 Tax=Musa balbisiana TaxID=52838 RepID=A0A4S8I7W2_MUSBA|nr:hypothetical protein C4D60_Mb02t03250 [Musa balbisiana]